MNQIKIGKFISDRRKIKKLTQGQLSEMLGVSDRAISKWENGVCLPDASNMVELCKILEITINDLFSGEIVDMNENEKRLEEHLLEMKKQKEETDKKFLQLEILIGVFSVIILLGFTLLASFLQMEDWLRVVLIVIGFVIGLIGIFFAVRIEQTAGYYECQKCGHKYVPTFDSVIWSMHAGRTRYMKCPHCGKKSWQKKVISK